MEGTFRAVSINVFVEVLVVDDDVPTLIIDNNIGKRAIPRQVLQDHQMLAHLQMSDDDYHSECVCVW